MSAPLKLSDIQKTIQDSLLNPYGSTFPSNLIKSSKRLSARDHLAIYQRSYTARLRECMSKQFSVLEYALGEELFRAFADEYLCTHPSTNYNLNELGKQFPVYLENSRPDKEADEKEDWPTFMIELATFEYSINVIFEEKANNEYPLAQSGVPEDTLQLIPVFHLFNFDFPIQKYYAAFAAQDEPELPLPENSYCAITRHDYNLSIHNLNRGQFIFLQILQSGKSLRAAKKAFLELPDVRESRFEELWPIWKNAWIKAGFFRLDS